MMNIIGRIERTIQITSQILLIILFLYSGVIKLLQHNKFLSELLQSPLLRNVFADFLSYLVPAFEISIVILLAMPKTLKVGYFFSFFLMLLFTLYLLVLSFFVTNAPCSCGGILGGMSYPVHIAFNIFFTLVALVGIYTHEEQPITEEQSA